MNMWMTGTVSIQVTPEAGATPEGFAAGADDLMEFLVGAAALETNVDVSVASNLETLCYEIAVDVNVESEDEANGIVQRLLATVTRGFEGGLGKPSDVAVAVLT